jgi:hypothetical protein
MISAIMDSPRFISNESISCTISVVTSRAVPALPEVAFNLDVGFLLRDGCGSGLKNMIDNWDVSRRSIDEFELIGRMVGTIDGFEFIDRMVAEPVANRGFGIFDGVVLSGNLRRSAP